MHEFQAGEIRRCLMCRKEAVTLQNMRGRAFDLRDEDNLVFDVDLTFPRCDACGELYARGESAQLFSETLERLHAAAKRDAVVSFVATIEREFANVPRQSWEDILGISRGYLSRLEKGSRNLTTPLEVILRGLTREPKQTLRVIANSRKLPEELVAYIR